jgi:hypothetical protein
MLRLLRVFEVARVAVDPRIRQVAPRGIGHLAEALVLMDAKLGE